MRLLVEDYTRLPATVISSSDESIHFPSSNLKLDSRGKRWRSYDYANLQAVTFDLAEAKQVDTVSIMWSKYGNGVPMSPTASIKLQASTTSDFVATPVDETLTIDFENEVASFYFPSIVLYRYWRVLVSDTTNPNGYLEIGKVWIGKSESTVNLQNGFKFNIDDASVVTKNIYGNAYIDQYPRFKGIGFDFSTLNATEIATFEKIFYSVGRTKTVLIVVDETDTMFKRNRYSVYGYFNNNFELSHIIYNLADLGGYSVIESG